MTKSSSNQGILIAIVVLLAACIVAAGAFLFFQSTQSDSAEPEQTESTETAEETDTATEKKSTASETPKTFEQAADGRVTKFNGDYYSIDISDSSMFPDASITYSTDFGTDSQSGLSMGCVATVTQYGSVLFNVEAFTTNWGPEGEFYTQKIGRVNNGPEGKPVDIWVVSGLTYSDFSTESAAQDYQATLRTYAGYVTLN